MLLKIQLQQFHVGALFFSSGRFGGVPLALLLQIPFIDLRTALKCLSVQVQAEGKILFRILERHQNFISTYCHTHCVDKISPSARNFLQQGDGDL